MTNKIKHTNKYQQLWVACLTIICITIFSCSSVSVLKRNYKHMNKEEKKLVDSLFTKALNHEALYTLLDTLKPISSVHFYRFSLLSTNKVQADLAYDSLVKLQRTVNKLSTKKIRFVLNPFEKEDSIYRNFELYVVRNNKLQQTIHQYYSFYSSIGISLNTQPETVLALTEYETKYNRWRSYGYLFGYPEYAVDFFVLAGKQQDSTKQFVKRDFFAIPVFAGDRGYFTYAIPKNYQTSTVDSSIYQKAMQTLEKYKLLRKKHLTNEGLKAVKLFLRNSKKIG
jgi:hypothetical protein